MPYRLRVISLPTGPNTKQKSDYDSMAKLQGASFDKMFAEHMVADHKKDIAEYEQAAKMQDAIGQYAHPHYRSCASTWKRLRSCRSRTARNAERVRKAGRSCHNAVALQAIIISELTYGLALRNSARFAVFKGMSRAQAHPAGLTSLSAWLGPHGRVLRRFGPYL